MTDVSKNPMTGASLTARIQRWWKAQTSAHQRKKFTHGALGASCFGAFVLAMALGGKKSPRVLIAWGVAALASLAAWKWLPPHTHVVAGALAGGLIGYFWLDQPQAEATAEEGEQA